jgi:hypothetical protein
MTYKLFLVPIAAVVILLSTVLWQDSTDPAGTLAPPPPAARRRRARGTGSGTEKGTKGLSVSAYRRLSFVFCLFYHAFPRCQ